MQYSLPIIVAVVVNAGIDGVFCAGAGKEPVLVCLLMWMRNKRYLLSWVVGAPLAQPMFPLILLYYASSPRLASF